MDRTSARSHTRRQRFRPLLAAAGILIALLSVHTATLGRDDRASLVAESAAFVDQMAAGEFNAAAARFDAVMTRVMPSEKLEEAWTAVQRSAGRFQQRTDTRVARDRGFDIVVVTCRFAKATLDVRVVFNADTEITGLWFAPHPSPATAYSPPAYADPDAFTERAVEIGKPPWRLPATLTLPRGEGPFPALILVQGSGPLDRDESVGPNKPFRDLAHGLATHGVAVLRYDKRTLTHGGKMAELAKTLTVQEESVDDAVAAFEFASHLSDIEAGAVFVLGHSLGGMLIPRIGARTPKAAGFIIMAGAARPLEDAVLDQTRYIAGLHPESASESERALEELESQVARVKDPDLSTDLPAERLPMGVYATYWLDLRGYRPAEAARTLPQPLLILQGGRDYQVTDDDFRLWREALDDRANVTFRRYPDLDHLFRAGDGQATPEDYAELGHVAETVVEHIAAWLRQAPLRQGAGEVR